MFANLKNKIFEEVKASPQKLQQFAQAAQAAVSSASSNTSESASGTDNFFSITEEDTPQNSPQKRLANKSSNEGIQSIVTNVPLNISTNGPTGPRTRRLSNSSAASDVSFRLPSYDSPAVYHLQSDLDISASEVEDSVGASFPKLEHISKEHLYDAYKKALTRYQKYRTRYTELANRYKELERDNGKARQVLVDTQDKAIRRISELKEQCSLEQQAKSHLEEALRMEMDDMQCKIKAYQTKLTLLGENSEVSDIHNNHNLIHLKADEPNLISLDTENNESFNKNENSQELQNRLKDLEKQLSESNNCADEMSGKINEYETVIENLKKREEENLLLLAQNKLMVHSELENKEREVKVLKANLVELENKLHQSQKNQSVLKSKIAEMDELQENLKKITMSKQDLEAKVISSEHIISELKQELKEKQNQLQCEKSSAEEKRKALLADFEDRLMKLQRQNEELNEMLRVSCKSDIELAEIDNELNMIRTDNEILTAQVNAINNQLENCEKMLQESQERETALKNSESVLKQELESLRNKLTEKEPEKHSLQRTTVDSNRDIEQSKEFVLKEKSQLELTSNQLREEFADSISQSCLNILQKNLITITDFVEANLKEKQEGAEEQVKLEMLKVQLASLLEETQNKLFLMDQRNNKSKMENEKEANYWELLLTNIEEKLKAVEDENVELIEKNNLIEQTYNEITTKLKDNESKFKEEVDILNGIIRETEAKFHNERNEKEAIHKNLKQLNEKLSQASDEKSQLYNAKEIIEKEVRSLKHQLEDKEKECNCAMNLKERAEAEIQILTEEVANLRRESSNLIEISNNMRGDFEILNSELLQEKSLRDKINIEYDNIAKIKISLEKEIEELQAKFQLLKTENAKTAKTKTDEIEELKIRNKCVEDQFDVLQKELHFSKQMLQEKEHLLGTLEDENQKFKQQIEDLIKEVDDIKLKNESCLTERDKNHAEEMTASIKNATDLEKKLQNYDKLITDNEFLKTLSSQFESDLMKCREENLQCNQDVENMKRQKEELQDKLNIFNEENQKRAEEIEFLSRELIESKDRINSLSESLEAERVEKKRATEQNINASSHNEFTQKELLLVQTKLAEAEKLCGETRENYENISNKNKHLEDEVLILSTRNQAFTKEVENNQHIINSLLEGQKNTEKQLEELANVEDENRQLQNRLKDLEVKLSTAEQHVEDISDYENVQKLNQDLKNELENLKDKTSAQISELNRELEDMSTNSQCLSDKLVNYEHLEQECNRLKDELDSLRKSTSNYNSSSDVDSIRQEKKDLENKLNKIMHEVQDVSNRNLFLEQKCENYLILEQSNVRLKLANEKLSRQLDETLVSMHHNEGIQANTEFEYLRNIMFQYLTGTVNGNSGTLVKVIAAVLKFSPQQTQIVLQKEQQRHSLLGQINHLL